LTAAVVASTASDCACVDGALFGEKKANPA